MWDYMKGALRAPKLTNIIMEVYRTTVNTLLLCGYDMKVYETVGILAECYAIVRFLNLNANPGDSDNKTTSMIYTINDNIKTVLVKLWTQQSNEPILESDVEIIVVKFEPYFNDWLSELLVEVKRDIEGQPNQKDYLDRAVPKFMRNIVEFCNSLPSVKDGEKKEPSFPAYESEELTLLSLEVIVRQHLAKI